MVSADTGWNARRKATFTSYYEEMFATGALSRGVFQLTSGVDINIAGVQHTREVDEKLSSAS